jgi:hypothetical protein
VPTISGMSHVPTLIPGLRSPYAKVGGIVVFGRMLDKIRLDDAGKLLDDWSKARGLDRGWDGRCCRFLGIRYPELETETLRGGSDEELLEWAFTSGRRPSAEEIEVWNGFMMKMGWRDSYSERVFFRLDEAGLPVDTVQTMFDFIEIDEGRSPSDYSVI